MQDLLKSVFLGALQGITEWLPISSTGHMILFNTFFPMNVSEEFLNLFLVVIQLFSAFAVMLLYGNRFLIKGTSGNKKCRLHTKLFGTLTVGILPCAVCGAILDDVFETYFYSEIVVATMLIVYGIVFISIEKKRKSDIYLSAEQIGIKTAFKIGCFQTLALIPGVSRSGATIIGAMSSGCSRSAATEFSFLLSLPVMLGATVLRVIKFLSGGDGLTDSEWKILLVGGVTAFCFSIAALRFLTEFVKKHTFRVFGIYRIILGITVLLLPIFLSNR